MSQPDSRELMEQLPVPARAMGEVIAQSFCADGDDALAFWSALLFAQLQQGRVCLSLDMPIEGMDLTHLADTLVEQSPAWLSTGEKAARPLVLRPDRTLWLQRYDAYDRALRGIVRQRQQQAGQACDEAQLQDDIDALFPEGVPAEPEHGQRIAAAALVDRLFGLLTGGPGTGKTASIVKLLLLFLSQEENAGQSRILLLAPTGKATQRLKEGLIKTLERIRPQLPAAAWGDLLDLVDPTHAACVVEFMTIHRALGARLQRRVGQRPFRHHADNPLPARLVVVDEVSMVDLALMAHLAGALTVRTPLWLVGDAAQLESVEAGSVLTQIALDAQAPDTERAAMVLARCRLTHEQAQPHWPRADHVQLTHNYRFGTDSRIGQLAQAVTAGDAEAFLSLIDTAEDAAVRWVRLSDEGYRIPAQARKEILAGYQLLIEHWEVDNGEDAALLAAFNQYRILCATHDGPDGATQWNQRIQRWIDGYGETSEMQSVLIQANDPVSQLYNGDTGLVWPDRDGTALFRSSDGRVQWPATMLPHHSLGWAMTIHKSQGSEYDHVAIVLPRQGGDALLTRRLLYTALTRARRRITLLATEDALRQMIQTA